MTTGAAAPNVVRSYAESRLYHTVAGRDLTLEDLRRWREDGVDVEVCDSESGNDITRVLA